MDLAWPRQVNVDIWPSLKQRIAKHLTLKQTHLQVSKSCAAWQTAVYVKLVNITDYQSSTTYDLEAPGRCLSFIYTQWMKG